MASDRSLLEREMERVELRPFTLEGFHRRRQRKQRNRRVGTAVAALAVAAAGIGGLVRAFSTGPVPAGDPRSAFVGTWVTTDLDGSSQTMAIRAAEDGVLDIAVHDDSARVCSGAPSTMTGTGRLDGTATMIVPSPVLTCDDGSAPEAQSGPPLEEQLRNLTFVHDPESDTLTDNFGLVWDRGEGMWPQSSLEDVREAQRRADAGDPRYTWQVDPELAAEVAPGDAEIFARFLEQELGWEEFRWGVGGFSYEAGDTSPTARGTYTVVFVRCAPGRTNPLYPNDPEGRGCAPTIDEFRYETVKISAAQLVRPGPSGIWVVTRWLMLPPSDELMPRGEDFFVSQVEQAVPPSDAEVTGLLEAFLQARVDGAGAQEYLLTPEEEIPVLYATSTGAPYERFEIERVKGPVWPTGGMEFKVRLFAEGGKTVVEQSFSLDRAVDGRLGLGYGSATPDPATTENGEPVAEPYEFLDGEVTFAAAPPWDHSWAGWDHSPTITTLLLDGNFDERLVLHADPLPVGMGCEKGRAPADAEALAETLRSDPDLEATEPLAVSVGGIEGLRMDVVAAPGASVCDAEESPQVLTATVLNGEPHGAVGLPFGHRMRLYLLDLPGGSARVLAIAIVAPEDRFERVLEAAASIVDSFEFRTR